MPDRTSCLLVSYTDVGVNSTEHAVAFGVGLARRGWDVRVAVNAGGSYDNGFAFHACETDGTLRPLSRDAPMAPADVVHVWTPRAPIWRFLERHQRLIADVLVLHLEDDETEVLRLFGARTATTDAVSRGQLRAMQLEDWTHPLLARCLTYAANGATIISPELAKDIPDNTRHLHVIPPLAPQWWTPIPAGALPADYQPAPSVVYTGGVHPAVAEDFFELCRAVSLLRERGHRIRLVRCGPKAATELVQKGAELAGDFLDLGHLPFDGLRALLASATVLVQPGAPTKYNRGRLPAKLAPYLASGTPVVMPANYDWLGVRDLEHAIFFNEGSAIDMADAIDQVLQSPESARAIAVRAVDFARSRFDLDACCAPLDAFYCSLPEGPKVPWQAMRNPRVELPLLLAVGPGRRSPPRRPTEWPPYLESDNEPIRNGGPASANALVRAAIEEVRVPVRPPGPITVAQLFWPTRGGYQEQASSVCALKSGRWTRLSFGPQLLPAKRAPRLDPGDRPGILEITAVDYRGSNFGLLHRFRPPHAAAPAVVPAGTTLALVPLQRNVWRWLSTGKDPQLLLPELPRGAEVRIQCWIRWTALE